MKFFVTLPTNRNQEAQDMGVLDGVTKLILR
jgi:hypothetical protein